jgi:Tfp pilus assembly ATPase PilU
MLNADSKNELRLRVKLESKRDKTVAADDSGGLTVMEDEKKSSSLY